MIIMPDYREEFKDRPFSDLMSERRDLQQRLDMFEKIATEEFKTSKEWDINPGPDVVYQVMLDAMSELCLYMSERYNREFE